MLVVYSSLRLMSDFNDLQLKYQYVVNDVRCMMSGMTTFRCIYSDMFYRHCFSVKEQIQFAVSICIFVYHIYSNFVQ